MGQLIGILLKQRPADSITVLFLLFLDALTLSFYPAVPDAPFLIGIYSVLAVVQIALARFKKKGGFVGVFHAVGFPIISVILIFDSLGRLVHYINPADIDPLLISLDYALFHGHPTVMLEGIVHPFLTDVLQLAYTSYYFIPISFGVILFKSGREGEFDRSVFLILLCFYLSYIGYVLFPALGPRFSLRSLQTVELQGLFIAEPVRRALDCLEGIKRDAFPSGHTAVTVLVLCLAYRYNKRYFLIALPVVSALILSTVYCRYHYVVDVIAGLMLTLLTLVIGERYYVWWERRRLRSAIPDNRT